MNYQTIATNFNAWKTYFDTDGCVSEEEFEELSEDKKIEMIEEAFGPGGWLIRC